MSGVTPEERAQAIHYVGSSIDLTDRSISRIEATVDCLIALGWAPVGAPVVDRETFVAALASALGWDWPEAEGVPSSEDVVTGIFDALREDTVFVDRVTVEREAAAKALEAEAEPWETLAETQRTEAARYFDPSEPRTWHLGQAAECMLRAGVLRQHAADYREGKR